MVFGILTAVAVCPAIIGTTESVRQGQRSNAREQHRGRKSHLVVRLPNKNIYSDKFDGARVVLKDKNLYVDTGDETLRGCHPFTGYYLPYPANQSGRKAAGWKGEGMVSTISEDPPFLNWIYVDARTFEVKYGVREEVEAHVTGPWDCTTQDRRVTFEGWEGFTIVKEDDDKDLWALYFDRNDDGLSGEGQVGPEGARKRMLQVLVERVERVRTKEIADEERAETLEKIEKRSEEQKKEREGKDQAEKQDKYEGEESMNNGVQVNGIPK